MEIRSNRGRHWMTHIGYQCWTDRKVNENYKRLPGLRPDDFSQGIWPRWLFVTWLGDAVLSYDSRVGRMVMLVTITMHLSWSSLWGNHLSIELYPLLWLLAIVTYLPKLLVLSNEYTCCWYYIMLYCVFLLGFGSRVLRGAGKGKRKLDHPWVGELRWWRVHIQLLVRHGRGLKWN